VNLQSIINGPLGVGTALFLARMIPPKPGYALANRLAALIARRRNTVMVQAVRGNQWVVSGESLSPAELDRAVLSTFQSTAHCLYDLYHYRSNPEAAARLIRITPQAEEFIRATQETRPGEGRVLVGLHMSNFDFVMQAAAGWGMRALAITLPELAPGYKLQYELRRKAGLDIRPASVNLFREAVRYLREGGTVLTGIDRPVDDSKYRVRFFRHLAPLPVFHIQLALKAGAPVYIAAAILQPDGIYEVHITGPIHLQPYPDRHEELVRNAETVLAVAEEIICQAPHQWAMFYPVWPEVIIPF